MSRSKQWAGGALALLAAMLVAADAPGPKALAATSPGLWEVTGQPLFPDARRLCLRDMTSLAQIQQRGANCTRVVIRDLPSKTEIHYTCAGGGFGQSKIQLLTPRSLRVETQGIAAGAPFNYVFQARRVGDCPVH